MKRHRIWLGLTAVVIVLVLAAAAASQARDAAATIACENGTVVPDPANNPGLVADCSVLLAARDTLAGTATLNWSASTPLTSWEGVSVSGTPSRVTALDLLLRSLTGTIPAGLASLSQLEELHLNQNQLTGSIPVELAQLSNLTSLNLIANDLTGSIPVELGQLSDLESLNLGANQLTGSIPVELGQLSNLTSLNLRGNQLGGGIPAELGQLSNLTRLDLYSNQLTGSIPVELGQLSNLQSLQLGYNQLTGSILVELGDLSSLVSLYLYKNQLTGSIPVELGQLSSLEWLSLGHNQLTGSIPVELGDLSSLVSLSLASNQLTGSIPAELGDLSNLRSLSLGWNQLTGGIPAELGDLSNLWSLHLSGNQLTGGIPVELGDLSNLSSLHLGWNQLTGGIPAELGDLSNLLTLSLGSNQLTGGIPVDLGDLSNLIELDLRSNQLTGGIPVELGQLSNLSNLYLAENELTGSIPAELGDLNSLGSLSLDSNQLTGNIPAELGQLTNLTWLRLGDNQLTGCVPPAIHAVYSTDIAGLGLPDCAFVTIAADAEHIGEGAAATFTVTRAGGALTEPLTVSVSVSETGAVIDGTAAASVMILANDTSAVLRVATVDDDVDEVVSVVTATLTGGALYNVGPPASAEVTVQDDPLVSFMAPEPITEGESAVFKFTRSGGVSHELEVSVSVLPTGDFLSGTAPTAVTFAVGSVTADLSIATDDDNTLEADGTIAVLLRQGTDYDTTGTLLQQVSVMDNDRPVVTITAVTTPIDEGASAVFTVTATGGVITEAFDVPVAMTETGSMISGTRPTSARITATQRSATVTVDTQDDEVPESDSVITATLTGGSVYDLGDPAAADLTVWDDDPVVWFNTLKSVPQLGPVVEGQPAVFTLERRGGVSHELEVSVGVLPTGDFLSGAAPTSVTFAAGDTEAPLSIPLVDDSTPEPDGTIAVLLRQGTDYNITGTLLLAAAVEDNDRSTVTISAVASPVWEGNSAVFRVTRADGTTTVPITVAIAVTETGAMVDGKSPASVLIPANQTSVDLIVATLGDTVDEVDSVITATLSSGGTYDLGEATSAEITVNDDDLPVLTITLDGTSPIEEGTTASFTVTRTGITTEALTINVSVFETGNMTDGTPPTTLTFAADSATVDLDIETEDDTVDEPDSTIFVGVTLPNSVRSRTPPDLVSVVVTDND